MMGAGTYLGRYQDLRDGLNRAVEGSLVVLGLTMAIIVCTQVFFRYVLNDSLFWSEELARFLLVWLTFLGATSAYHRGVHPRIETFAAMLPPKLQKGLRIGIHLISLILFSLIIFYGIKFSYFVRLQISPALNLPKWIVTAVIPLSGMILCFHNVGLIARELLGRPHDS